MNPRRKTNYSLSMTRIYVRGRRYCYFSSAPIENPKTGKVAKWHTLCKVIEGEERARVLLAELLRHNAGQSNGRGNMPGFVEEYRLRLLKKREKKRPREPARVKMFDASNAELTRVCGRIKDAFEDFNVEQVLPIDITKFVDQWEGQRMAQVYRARLFDFFKWAVGKKNLRTDNPVQHIETEKPSDRDRYVTHAEFYSARDALLIGKDGRPTPSGPMIQCYVDLCYLLYQRATEIRLLKWSQIDLDAGLIHFKPTKTEESSGLKVAVRINDAVRAVLERAKAIGKVKGLYVIHTLKGQPYTSRGIGDAWERACDRALVVDATLKDIRAKAATDAKEAGYTREQIKVGLAHTSEGMTDHYLRGRETPVSEVQLAMPARPKAA